MKSQRAILHNSKCRYGERGAADAKPKAQIILDAAKVSAASGGNSEPKQGLSAASGGNSEPKQGQRSQSARGFCPRSTMRVPQPDIIEHFGNATAVPQLPERCLSRKAGIVRCCQRFWHGSHLLSEVGPTACRSTMRVPQPDIIEHFGNATAVPQLPERCLSRKAGIVRCCQRFWHGSHLLSEVGPTACRCV